MTQLITDSTFVVLDLETTGLNPWKGDEIVEVACVKVCALQITGESFQSLVNPGRKISEGAARVNQIRESDLVEAPKIETLFPELLSFLGDHVLVMHNAPFDMGFIRKYVARFRMSPLVNGIVDTRLLSKAVFPAETSHNLDALLKRLSIRFEKRHRAFADACLTAQALIAMLKKLETEKIRSIEELMTLLLQQTQKTL